MLANEKVETKGKNKNHAERGNRKKPAAGINPDSVGMVFDGDTLQVTTLNMPRRASLKHKDYASIGEILHQKNIAMKQHKKSNYKMVITL